MRRRQNSKRMAQGRLWECGFIKTIAEEVKKGNLLTEIQLTREWPEIQRRERKVD